MAQKDKYTGFRYDPASRRYRDRKTGKVTPLRDIQAIIQLRAGQSDSEVDGAYGKIVNFSRHPDSDVWAALERIVGQGERGNTQIVDDPDLKRAASNFNQLLTFYDRDNMDGAKPYPRMVQDGAGNWVAADDHQTWEQPPQPIPTGIRSAMTLAQYYTDTQGDIWQHIEVPIDLSISKLEISVPKDRKLQTQLEDFYGPEKLNMRNILYQIMLNTGIFGSAYPMEVPDNADNPNEISQVIPLPPKYMWVGYHIVSGMLAPPNYPSPYAMRPWDGSPNWTQDLARKMFMPQTYNAYASGFNEQIVQGWGLPVNPQYLHPVRAKALQWIRYPLPPISRAFRSISTRAIYQEMRRALLEGFKNQLWLFLLGSEKVPPSPQEMLALQSAINGLSGVRTGNLVWRYGLDVKVLAPAAIQDAIANEVSQAFTLECFRDLGANVRLVTGNKVAMRGAGGGDAGIDIDLSVWLRRMEYIRESLMEWEFLFRMRQADRWDGRKSPDDPEGPARKALKTAKVKFSKSLLEISAAIKQEIIPLYQVGLSSPQTSLAKADMDYETELKNKKEYEPNKEMFVPPATYNQIATSAGGKTTQSAATAPKGRPADVVNPNQLKAAWQDSDTRRRYYAAVAAILDSLWRDQNVDQFVADLKQANIQYLDQAGTEAYHEAGGVGIPNLEKLRHSSNYVNSYADHYGDDLKQMLEGGEPIGTDQIRRRTMLYPQEGYRSAVVNGTNQAMAERGASHWRRLLHPELSKKGPCPDCVADSQVIHDISEPFQVLHPYEACEAQELYLQYYSGGIPSIEVPVPGSGSDLAQEIFSNKKQGTARRKRL